MSNGAVAWQSEALQCSWVDEIPVYAKSIGGIAIDPSEFEDPEKGAIIMTDRIACRNVADSGEKYCPKHTAIAAIEAAKQVEHAA